MVILILILFSHASKKSTTIHCVKLIIPVMCLTFTIAILMSFGDLTFVPAQILDTTTTVLLLVPLLLLLLLPSAVVCLDSFSLWRDGEDGSVANWVPVANCSRTSSEKQNENVSWE